MLRPKIENIPHQWPAVYIQINFLREIVVSFIKISFWIVSKFPNKNQFYYLTILQCVELYWIKPPQDNALVWKSDVRQTTCTGRGNHNVPNNFCDAGCRQGGQALWHAGQAAHVGVVTGQRLAEGHHTSTQGGCMCTKPLRHLGQRPSQWRV